MSLQGVAFLGLDGLRDVFPQQIQQYDDDTADDGHGDGDHSLSRSFVQVRWALDRRFEKNKWS